MAQVHALLGRTQPTSTSDVTLYTSPASTKTLVTSILIANDNASSRTCRVYAVPSGGSAGVTNAITYELTIGAAPIFPPIELKFNLLLEAGDFLVVRASAANDLTFTASGIQITGTASQTHKLLGRSAPTTTNDTTIYTAPASTKTLVTSMAIVATNGSPNFRVYAVPSGGTAGVTNALSYNVAGPNVLLKPNVLLETGDFLAVRTSVANDFTFTASGIEITGTSTQTHKLLGRSAPTTTSNTTIYTAPASTKTLITSLVICPTTATPNVRVFAVPSGGSAGATNAIYYDVITNNGGENYYRPQVVLETGDFLSVRTDNADDVTFTASGIELT